MSDADPRRDQIARVIYETRYGEPWFEALDGAGRAGAMREADAVVPILRAAVEQARADTAEQALLDAADQFRPGDGNPWVVHARTYLRERAADIARQHGRQP